MKYYLIIIALLHVSYSYSQADRFNVNHLTQSGLKYEAESFDQSLYTPMMHKQRSDENYEKLRKLRNELNNLKEDIKLNKENYSSTIDEINNILYKLLTDTHTNFAHPDIDKIIKMTSVFIDDTISKYNEDVRKYNERLK